MAPAPSRISPNFSPTTSVLPRKKSGFRKLFFTIALVWVFFWIRATGDVIVSIHEQTLHIPRGASLSRLAQWMPDFPVSSLRYRLWFTFTRPSLSSLQTGDYRLPANTSLSQLFTLLARPAQSEEVEMTFLPGWNLADYDAYFAKNGFIDAGELLSQQKEFVAKFVTKYPFLKNTTTLEGFLLPETYRFAPAQGLQGALDRMLSEFQKQAPQEFFTRKDAHDVLVMASILQKEEHNPKNQPLVAGILWKRASTAPGYLGADATVCYEKILPQEACENFVAHYYSLSRDEKESLNYTYDTRRVAGLPPTPISSVTPQTLLAALRPQSSPYWYYLHGLDGQIHYATTLDEHVQNKKYLR